MRLSQTRISRLMEDHYQITVSYKMSTIIRTVNGDYAYAQKVSDHFANGLDDLICGIPVKKKNG